MYAYECTCTLNKYIIVHARPFFACGYITTLFTATRLAAYKIRPVRAQFAGKAQFDCLFVLFDIVQPLPTYGHNSPSLIDTIHPYFRFFCAYSLENSKFAYHMSLSKLLSNTCLYSSPNKPFKSLSFPASFAKARCARVISEIRRA